MRTDVVGLAAFPESGWEGEALARVDVELTKRWSVHALGGVQRFPWGAVAARDALVGARVRLVQEDDLAIALAPRLSVPLGSVGDGLAFNPGSTGSFDPALGGDLVYGGKWLLVLDGQTRVPLYAGADDILQGPFVRGDVRGAVRAGDGVVAVGTSTVLAWPADDGLGGFTEVAATLGGVIAPFKRHAFGAQLRAPVWTNGENYRLAVATNWSAVWGGKKKTEEHKH